jgi:hypothetical protein
MTNLSTHGTRNLALGALLLAGLGLAGCSDDGSKAALAAKRYPVKGKVLLADGKPLGEGTITLVPYKKPDEKATSTNVGLLASAKLNADGTFETEAAEGEYQVKLSRPSVELKPAAGQPVAPPALKFPEKYLDEDASGLKATVAAGPTDLPPFQLK